MKPRPKTRKLGKFFLRLAVVSMATFAIGIIWFVTGPASRTYVVDPTGIPQNAWPKLSATSAQDLPLACTFVARDKSIADPAARPHRNHTYLAKYGGKGVFRNDRTEPDKSIAMLEARWVDAENDWLNTRLVIEGFINNYAPVKFGQRLVMGLHDSDRTIDLGVSDDDGINWAVRPPMQHSSLSEPGDKGPATAQAIAAQSEFKLAPRLATGICNKNLPAILRRLFGYAGCVEHFVWG